MSDDLKTSGTAPPEMIIPRRVKRYTYFLKEQRSTLYYNSKAYKNKRRMSRLFQDSRLRRVLKRATFIPANINKIKVGAFNLEKMQYFVLHRPGVVAKACTLLNVLREFSSGIQPGKQAAAAHFVAGKNGELIQMVDLNDKAPHTGVSQVAHNYNSVGVEIEGSIYEPITMAQYRTVAQLIRDLHQYNQFLPSLESSNFESEARKKILGHSEISPGRKQDPGPFMNYNLLIYLVKHETEGLPSSQLFKDPFDPFVDLESSLQEILAQANDPENAAKVSMLQRNLYDSFSFSRVMHMALMTRPELVGLAVNANFSAVDQISQRMINSLRQAFLLEERVPEVPNADECPFFDFDEVSYES